MIRKVSWMIEGPLIARTKRKSRLSELRSATETRADILEPE